MALGAAADESLTREVHRVIGAELNALGVNLNFAPLADVNNNRANPVIGVRSFGEDPDFVGRHVQAAIAGLHESKVGATAKHFPGHGDTTVDSHFALPVIAHSLERLRGLEMQPFRSAITAGVDAIMTAHVAFPAIDADGLPATLSRAVLSGLLREELCYDGVICTDCMEMNAIAERFPAGTAAVQAVAAGADLVLFSHSADQAQAAVGALRDALNAGSLNERQVQRSIARVDELRARLGTTSTAAAGAAHESALASVGGAAHHEVARRAARKAITLVRDPHGSIPLRLGAGAKAFIVQFAGSGLTPVEDAAQSVSALAKELRSSGVRLHEQVRSLDPAGHAYKQLLMASASADAVIAVTRRAAQHPLQAQAVNDLALLGKPVIAVAAREPYDAAVLAPEVAVLASYGDDDVTMQCVADVLLGRAVAGGVLPVVLSGGAGPKAAPAR
jgi:beta-N-acetylhexosaminidase